MPPRSGWLDEFNKSTTGQHGEIVTFYSYKGGTGRTMTLANVAWVLASTGARVLAIDWDLEAPGLQRYFRAFLADMLETLKPQIEAAQREALRLPPVIE